MRGWLGRRGRGDDDRRWREFEALVGQYERPFYRVAYRLTGDPDDAADLLQDALVEAYRNFDRFRPGSRFDAWVYRIMTNRQIDRARRRRKVTMLSLDQGRGEDDEGGWELPDAEADPERQVVEPVLDQRIQDALAELAPEYREAVVLADIEGLPYEEVASLLDCPVGTVRSRLHRGRKKLRDLLVAAGLVATSREDAPESAPALGEAE